MSSAKLNVDGILLLEQPFLKVPHENLRKIFRTSQKNIEKEFTNLQTVAEQHAKNIAQHEPAETLKTLDNMIAKVEGLKRKLEDLSDKSTIPTQAIMRKRLQHLSSVDTMSGRDDPDWDRWADTRLDRWLVDWTLRNGHERTAMQMAHDRGIEDLVDIELFTDIRRIENALASQSCTEALLWCSENKAGLRKSKSTLEFDLRLQEYIELARAQKIEEARAYSRKHLIAWYDTHAAQINHAAALLIFSQTTTCMQYKRLYDLGRWKQLSRTFRLAAYDLSSLSTQPILHLALYAGLASLKVPSCYAFANAPKSPSPTTPSIHDVMPRTSTYSSLSAHLIDPSPPPLTIPDRSSRNVDCPTCDPECLGQLAHEVPWSHHVNSTIVCRITGKIMDGDNPPLAFPNGQVYSREALKEMADRNSGKVTCPKTGEVCEFETGLKKVFIT